MNGRTINHVIPRRGNAPTWESPGTMYISAQQVDDWYQEIVTGLKALAMTYQGRWSFKLKFEPVPYLEETL